MYLEQENQKIHAQSHSGKLSKNAILGNVWKQACTTPMKKTSLVFLLPIHTTGASYGQFKQPNAALYTVTNASHICALDSLNPF